MGSFFYTSARIGKNGRVFLMYKIRTLKEGNNGQFAKEAAYTWCGRFLRKWRIDELPQLWNIVRGDMQLCGPRPREEREINLYPEHIRNKILSIKPGLFCPSGIHFIDEEKMLQLSEDSNKDYFEKILPIKIALDIFYIENKCILLDIALIYVAIRRRLLVQ